MLKRVVITICAVALSATVYAAQPKSAAPAKKPGASAEQAKPVEAKTEAAAPKAAPEPPPLPVNIKVEVSITDQTGNNAPARKVVSMIASDRQNTNVRSSASVPVKTNVFGGPAGGTTPDTYTYRNVTINVDARPSILQKEPSKISVSFGLEYLPKTQSSKEEMEPGMTSWSERLSLILESGKPMVVSQAADPTSDRKITVEVTATILK
jgi:hypothetical protein